MGCTSSAQNMADSQTSTTDNLEHNLKFGSSEEIARENKFNSNSHQNLDQKLVLPESEIENNQAQLDRNNSYHSSDENNSKLHTVDVQVSVLTEATGNTVDNAEISQINEHKSLRDVVEKVISENTNEDEQNLSNVEEIKDADKQIEEIMEINDKVNDEEIEYKDNNSEESVSPTQSEDSRATRWEALADIAAELPPSLAVDPLTGQIYTLTK